MLEARGGGGRTRGGGAGRIRSKHPADPIVADTIEGYYDEYLKARDRAQAILHGYLSPRIRKADVEHMTDKQKRDYLLSLFTGAAWLMARRRLVKVIVDVDVKATKTINDALPYAASEGWNRTVYDLTAQGGGGHTRGGGSGRLRVRLPDDPPDGIRGKKLNRAKDRRWIETRIQSISVSVVLQNLPIVGIIATIARRIVDSIRKAMDTHAQSTVSQANDTGAYLAGIAAEAAGIDCEKTWLGIMDSRIRDSHRHLHGTTLPMDGIFHGLHGDLRYPHDPDAPMEETINCRCRLAVHLKGKSPGPYSYRLMPDEVAKYQRWRDEQIGELSRQVKAKTARRRRS